MMLALLVVAVPAQAQTIDSMVSAVSDSALFTTIAGLQGFGSRHYLFGNSSQVAKWVRGQFVASGLADVVLDAFTYGGTVQTNVVATLPGIRYPHKEIVVGGHVDSWASVASQAPGADDDASGTAAVLEIARVIVSSGYRPAATIRFIGFAAEEAGLEGSGHYAEEAKVEGRDIALMINFDMIGYTSSANPERRFYVVSYSSGTEIAGLVSSAATMYTSLVPVTTTQYQGNVDSYSFAARGYAAATCIEYVFNPFYHSTNDLLSALDSSYVRDITRTGLAAILLFDADVASSVPPQEFAPAAARLDQNYPNPFNPRTVISSQLPAASHVRLVVYDVLGREVAVLADERRTAGTYRDTFDAGGFSSGVYIYRLTAGQFVESRSMILLR